MKKTITFPSKKEIWTVLGLSSLFLLLTAVCIGLRPEHIYMVILYLILFFAGQPTRKLAVALLPFAIFGISYDYMRIFPNYEANPIDVEGLYNLEKSLFGINENGTIITPCEYFAIHHCQIADFFAGIFLSRRGRMTGKEAINCFVKFFFYFKCLTCRTLARLVASSFFSDYDAFTTGVKGFL